MERRRIERSGRKQSHAIHIGQDPQIDAVGAFVEALFRIVVFTLICMDRVGYQRPNILSFSVQGCMQGCCFLSGVFERVCIRIRIGIR